MNREQLDIESIIQNRELFLPYANADVLITGATGFIGTMLAKVLFYASEKYDLNINIIGLIRSEEKAKKLYGGLYSKIKFIKEICGRYEYIIHTLSPTSSKYFVENPVETIKASVESTIKVLENAKESNASLVYLSSMEQYGVPYEEDNNKMTENMIGIIDHLNVRSSYSESKRLCECLCVSYASEYDVDVKIARLAQTFGAGIPLSDNRMPMQFAKAVVENKDIVLHTEGRSVINTIYITDAITGILTIMNKGEKGEAYNVCNDSETRSVREIAELVANEVAGGCIGVRIELDENMGYAPDVEMYLDSNKLQKLGYKAKVHLIEAYNRLVCYIDNSCRNRVI